MNTRVDGYSSTIGRFGVLCDILSGYGGDYDPSQQEISPVCLKQTLNDLETCLGHMEQARADYLQALRTCRVHRREALNSARFALRSLTLSRTSPATLEKSTALMRSISVSLPLGADSHPLPAAERTHGLSFDGCLLPYQAFVSLLASEPAYRPVNGFDSLAHLKEVEQRMMEARMQLAVAAYRLAQGQATCERLLHAADTGAMARIRGVKKFIRDKYGKDSPRYRKLSELRFRRTASIFT